MPAARDGVSRRCGLGWDALLNLAFLPHHMLLSLDAIFRSMARRFISGKQLLEWETAAQAEAGVAKKTPLDWYLRLSPVVSLVIAALLAWHHRRSADSGGPVLVLWACAPLISKWLNSPPRSERLRCGRRISCF